MWLFTVYGFFSVVSNDQDRSGHTVSVRARSRKHLQLLKARFNVELKKCDVIVTPGADYRWRIVVDRVTWARVASSLAVEVAWGNFKDECHGRASLGPDYGTALVQTWRTMHAVQTAEEVRTKGPRKPGTRKRGDVF